MAGLSIAALAGCAADDATDVRPSEVVSPPEQNAALALLRDGDAIYVARPLRLDKIDARTGAVEEAAGPEWAQCPRDPSVVWMSAPLDFTYPNLTVRGSTLFLVHEECGLWSFDIETKTSHMLLDPTVDGKKAYADAGNPYPDGALWNGQPGPDWGQYYGMTIAPDGDGLVACFESSAYEPFPNTPSARGYRNRIELWSVALDGTPRERLAFISRERTHEDGEKYCKQLIPDATSILVGTDHALLRFDRGARTLSRVAALSRFGSDGVATDGTNVFFVKDNAIVSVPRDGGEVVTLRPSSRDPREVVRTLAMVDGDYVYFSEGHTLRRMRKDGTDLIDFAQGDESAWILPMAVVAGDAHVYFQRMAKDPVDESYRGTLLRAAK